MYSEKHSYLTLHERYKVLYIFDSCKERWVMDFILGIQSNTDEYVDSSMPPKLIKLLDTAQHIHISHLSR